MIFTGDQHIRFETTTSKVNGRVNETEPTRKRMVYPCYCYKPPQEGEQTTAGYEKYMIETKDVFILNK